ncbi:YraN family protein [Clostridiaceae bacterium 35-E11]
MSNKRITLGMQGEKIAVEYLRKNHYKIVCSNYRCRFGEIDIIAYKNQTYVFVEVKTRKNLSFGRPIEAINYRKKIHLLNTAQYYIQVSNLNNYKFRFDAIEIMVLPNESPRVTHIENILL